MTYIRSVTILFILVVLYGIHIFLFSKVVLADTWKDTFEDNNLDGWKHATIENKNKGWDSVWKSENGVLNFTFTQTLQRRTADLLIMTALPISSTKLKVKATLIKGTLGIALGVPGKGKSLGDFYVFRSGVIHHIHLLSDGSQMPIGFPADILIPSIPLGQRVEVIFFQGKFQLFSDGRLYAQFFDEDYPKIEAVGIFCRGKGHLHHELDNFYISTDGDPLSVNGKNKLTTTWGYIKRRQR